MTEGVFITTEVTNQDIYKKLNEMSKVQEQILTHAEYTNGRVTKLEARSIGNWIGNHPFKAVAILLVVFSILDPRGLLLGLVTKLFI